MKDPTLVHVRELLVECALCIPSLFDPSVSAVARLLWCSIPDSSPRLKAKTSRFQTSPYLPIVLCTARKQIKLDSDSADGQIGSRDYWQLGEGLRVSRGSRAVLSSFGRFFSLGGRVWLATLLQRENMGTGCFRGGLKPT